MGWSAETDKLFTPATALLTMLVRGHSEGKLEQRLAQLAKPKLLIVDEFGYLPFEPVAAHLLFQPVSRRLRAGQHVDHFQPGRERLERGARRRGGATAILDRLLHHSHVLTIRGDSYWLREKRRSGLLKANTRNGIRRDVTNSGGGWVLSVAHG
jgi:DNA replication protein DnaC